MKIKICLLILMMFITTSCARSEVNKNIYGTDNNDVISMISEKGEYKLKSGYSFNKYNKSQHFELYYDGLIKVNEKISNERLIELEEEYDRILSFFQMKKSDMPIIKIYMFHDDYEVLQQSLELELGERYEHYTGKNVKSNSIYILNQSSIVYNFIECVILNYAKEEDIPAWLVNGTTSYLSFSEDPYLNYYANYSELNSLDFDKLSEESILSKSFGHSLVNCIVGEYGEDKLLKLLTSYGNVDKVLGISYDELYVKWIEHVKRNSPDNIYGLDDSNIIEEIDKSGYYEDECGYKFDAYINNNHFEVYYNSKAYNSKIRAENLINYLEENYVSITNLFKVNEADMPVVKINMYTEYSSFANIAREKNLTMEYGFTGMSTKANRMYLSYHQDKEVYEYEFEDAKTVALHEFIHSVHKSKSNKKYIETWLLEGLAMFYSQKTDVYGTYYYNKFAIEGLPIKDEDINVNTLNNNENKYIYGYSIIEYILNEYGLDMIDKLINNYGDIEKSIGIPYKEFSDGWRAFIKNKL